MKIFLDQGFMFGIGLFETIAVTSGHAVLLEAHLKRLHAGLETLGIERTVDKKQIVAYIQREQLQEGAVKVMVSEKNLICVSRSVPYTEAQFQKGFKLIQSSVRRNSTSPLTYLKSFHYADNFFEKKSAQLQGFDEPVFLNEKGQICEGATTNLFFIQNGRLYTPPVSCGLLNGIMRQYMIQTYSVEEKIFTMDMLSEVEAMFVTNSLMGIMPVSEFAGFLFPLHPKIYAIRNEYERIKSGL